MSFSTVWYTSISFQTLLSLSGLKCLKASFNVIKSATWNLGCEHLNKTCGTIKGFSSVFSQNTVGKNKPKNITFRTSLNKSLCKTYSLLNMYRKKTLNRSYLFPIFLLTVRSCNAVRKTTKTTPTKTTTTTTTITKLFTCIRFYQSIFCLENTFVNNNTLLAK